MWKTWLPWMSSAADKWLWFASDKRRGWERARVGAGGVPWAANHRKRFMANQNFGRIRAFKRFLNDLFRAVGVPFRFIDYHFKSDPSRREATHPCRCNSCPPVVEGHTEAGLSGASMCRWTHGCSDLAMEMQRVSDDTTKMLFLACTCNSSWNDAGFVFRALIFARGREAERQRGEFPSTTSMSTRILGQQSRPLSDTDPRMVPDCLAYMILCSRHLQQFGLVTPHSTQGKSL